MADEILHSSLETDLRMASRLERELRFLLTDRASLRSAGVVTFVGDVAGFGSDTIGVRYAGLAGANEMSATVAEDTAVANTALTDASATVAVVRAALRREIGDLANLTGYPGSDIDPFLLAEDMAASFEGYFNSLVANVIDDFSTDVGTSGVDLSVDDWFDGIYTLELADIDERIYAVIHARQLADLQESVRGEAGAFQYMAASAEMLMAKGQGYAGSLLGVDIWRSSNVTSAGGNRHGAMFGAGALGYAIGTPKPLVGANGEMRPAGTPVVVEFARPIGEAVTAVIGHAYAGVSIIEQARGVGIVTDA